MSRKEDFGYMKHLEGRAAGLIILSCIFLILSTVLVSSAPISGNYCPYDSGSWGPYVGCKDSSGIFNQCAKEYFGQENWLKKCLDEKWGGENLECGYDGRNYYNEAVRLHMCEMSKMHDGHCTFEEIYNSEKLKECINFENPAPYEPICANDCRVYYNKCAFEKASKVSNLQEIPWENGKCESCLNYKQEILYNPSFEGELINFYLRVEFPDECNIEKINKVTVQLVSGPGDPFLSGNIGELTNPYGKTYTYSKEGIDIPLGRYVFEVQVYGDESFYGEEIVLSTSYLKLEIINYPYFPFCPYDSGSWGPYDIYEYESESCSNVFNNVKQCAKDYLYEENWLKKCFENIYGQEKIICGSDGKNYYNTQIANACGITKKHDGSCTYEEVYDNEKLNQCIFDEFYDPFWDSGKHAPVCGSDCREYYNECALFEASKVNNIYSVPWYNEKCDPCMNYKEEISPKIIFQNSGEDIVIKAEFPIECIQQGKRKVAISQASGPSNNYFPNPEFEVPMNDNGYGWDEQKDDGIYTLGFINSEMPVGDYIFAINVYTPNGQVIQGSSFLKFYVIGFMSPKCFAPDVEISPTRAIQGTHFFVKVEIPDVCPTEQIDVYVKKPESSDYKLKVITLENPELVIKENVKIKRFTFSFDTTGTALGEYDLLFKPLYLIEPYKGYKEIQGTEKTIFIIPKAECLTIHQGGNGNPDKKLDFTLVADKFATQKEFEEIGNKFKEYLFRIEPFKSNQDKINIHLSLDMRDDICVDWPVGLEAKTGNCKGNILKEAASVCPSDYVAVISRAHFRSFATFDIPGMGLAGYLKDTIYLSAGLPRDFNEKPDLNQLEDIKATAKDSGITLVHEYGHAFGRLLDEYQELGEGDYTWLVGLGGYETVNCKKGGYNTFFGYIPLPYPDWGGKIGQGDGITKILPNGYNGGEDNLALNLNDAYYGKNFEYFIIKYGQQAIDSGDCNDDVSGCGKNIWYECGISTAYCPGKTENEKKQSWIDFLNTFHHGCFYSYKNYKPCANSLMNSQNLFLTIENALEMGIAENPLGIDFWEDAFGAISRKKLEKRLGGYSDE